MPKLFADTRPLQVPAYRRLYLANVVTVIGAQLTVVSVPAQIYALTKSSGYVGLTGLFGLVPLVIFGLYGGAIADTFNKRSVLLVTTIGMIATTGGFFLLSLFNNQNVWALLAMFSVQQACFAVNQPTRGSVFPRILPGGLLASAAALNATLMQFGAIVGPLVAGALLPFTGFTWLYALDALSMLTTFWAVWRLPSLPPVDKSGVLGWRSVVSGFQYLAAQPVLLVAFAADLVAMIAGMPRALFPEIAHLNFGEPAEGSMMLSLLYASLGVGAVAGGLFSGWVANVRKDGQAVFAWVAVWGLAIALAGLAASLCHGTIGLLAWMVPLGLFLAGMADMYSMAFRAAILQQAAQAHIQGRIQGFHIIVVAGGPRLADILHGGAADVIGAGPTMAAGGLLTICGIAGLALVAKQFREYRRPDTSTEVSPAS